MDTTGHGDDTDRRAEQACHECRRRKSKVTGVDIRSVPLYQRLTACLVQSDSSVLSDVQQV